MLKTQSEIEVKHVVKSFCNEILMKPKKSAYPSDFSRITVGPTVTREEIHDANITKQHPTGLSEQI